MVEQEKHASVKTYWILAVILCVITFVEWVIFKIETVRTNAAFMIPVLSGLSIAKFIMVCGWYMHLRYDHGILWKVFAFSAFLATGTFFILFLALM